MCNLHCIRLSCVNHPFNMIQIVQMRLVIIVIAIMKNVYLFKFWDQNYKLVMVRNYFNLSFSL